MKIILIFYFLGIYLSGYTQSSDDYHVLRLSLEGQQYEQLVLNIMMDHFKIHTIKGKEVKKNTWSFSITDTVFKKHYYMTLVGYKKNKAYLFSFNLNEMNISDFSWNKNRIVIKAKYLQTDTLKLNLYSTLILDCWNIKKGNKEIYVFPQLLSKIHKISHKPYQEKLEFYSEFFRQYDSQSCCLAYLYHHLGDFKTKKDIQNLYKVTSKKNKNSFWGRKIEKYLTLDTFPNLQLMNGKNGQVERVIEDKTKYNLVVFSASWCQPCHELIPLLKNYYQNGHQNLNITYISLDTSSGLPNWRKMIETHQIQWRDLIAPNQINEIKDIYSISGIPLCYLVFPDGTFEKINIKKDGNKLNKLLSN